ncbi:hypothetical protein [Buchananella hordeovulneris]|uniref:hypothetical protein n=1 Tax=Buchananella hordeovulneris TaxID=52770 RepID=UPI0011611F7E|nr:hypothetical protein [Buchananella hordeovulneris]
MKRKFLTITLIATCLVTTACTAEPLNIVPGTSPTPGAADLRVTEAAGLIVRDDINIAIPPGWEKKKTTLFDPQETVRITRKDDPQLKKGWLDVTFLSQKEIYRSPLTHDLTKTLDFAVRIENAEDNIRLNENTADGNPLRIDNNPTRAYSSTSTYFTSERYFILRSDGVWELSIYAPEGEAIPPELRQAVLSATWNEAPEPNIPIPYRVSD